MLAMARIICAPWRWVAGFALLLAGQAIAAPDAAPVPGAEWERIASPEAVGWSTPKLALAREHSKGLDTAAVMLVINGKVLDEWGRTQDRYNIHSIRKSILSGLIGIAVGEGKMRIDATLGELGIDDNAPALTDAEKRATVGDLLKARSGVYHPALYESPAMAAARPARGSHAPGSFWYYNNWDFNALNTIYEAQAKTGFYTAFVERLAKPLQMQDWRAQDGEYFRGNDSIHAAYPMHMSARDLARFGLLYLRGGQWGGKQLIPAAWIQQSLQSYSDRGVDGGYGYMWWVEVDGRHLPSVRVPAGTFSAQGVGVHLVVVVPAYDLVVVHRVDTDNPRNQVNDEQFGRLLKMILDARLAPKP
ncbi:beta-lactamase family protein [Acidovorax sp. LjRoot66]|uniref:serine hydrolase domain-containing protein n=1 Tax=Acidovorax sp. LjRoot66 TaxID=3342334 RepID=UPI003ECD59F4